MLFEKRPPASDLVLRRMNTSRARFTIGGNPEAAQDDPQRNREKAAGSVHSAPRVS
jgi:hypothetical protein